jgi:hypothetical protein
MPFRHPGLMQLFRKQQRLRLSSAFLCFLFRQPKETRAAPQTRSCAPELASVVAFLENLGEAEDQIETALYQRNVLRTDGTHPPRC